LEGLDVRLLGPLEVRVGGAAIELPGAAERGLLALLLLSPGRVVAATSLIDRLWTETTMPVDPVNALQLRVSKLRKVLTASGLSILSRVGAGYRMDVDPEAVDTERFAREIRTARASTASQGASTTALAAYDAALQLWRGEPLADFATESWAEVEAARLTQLWRAALTERAEVALALGRHREVVGDLEAAVTADPTHEALVGLLMTALYRSGRQVDALEVYSRTRTLLDDELGLEPSAALRSLQESILRQDAGLAEVPARPAPHEPETGGQDGPVARPSPPTTNLPAAARPLIGRANELGSVGELLTTARLVSLVGPGGAGKTALALAAARSCAERFPDGAWLTRLAQVSEPGHVALAVADALAVPLDGGAHGRDVRERLVSFLARRQLLLVLDNCEHLVDAAAKVVDDVLARCPGVTVLTTSREALAVPGEVQVAVAPLRVPPEGAAGNEVLSYPAAQLFAERARAVRADLELDETELAAVAAICAQLDGMPLALELAAARISSLSAVELSARLTDRFALLTVGARTAEARQQTLRATVDWSHDLLTHQERVAFRRLAVFHGGWTLVAAESVVADDDVDRAQVLDALAGLVSRSMVIAEPGRPTRYRMLETLRQYAAERLAESDEDDLVRSRHAGYFSGVADHAEQTLRGSGQRTTLRMLREEQPNLRAALAWLSAHPDRVDGAMSMAGSLGLFWHLGRHVEGRDVLRRILAAGGGSPSARARALQAVSLVERPRACLVHPSPLCAQTARESLALFELVGDQQRAALSKVLLAVQGVDGSAPAESEQLLREADAEFARQGDGWGQAVIAFVRMESFLKAGDESRALATGRVAVTAFRALDDPWGLSAVLYHLGWGLRQFGRYAEAVPVLEEAIEVSEAAALYNTAQWARADLGVTYLHLGQLEGAEACFDRAGAASDEVGDGAGEVLAAYGRGVMARVTGRWSTARPLLERAVAGFQVLGTPVAEAYALAGLARCDEQDGLYEAARERYQQALSTGSAAGEPALRAAALEGMARLAVAQGDDTGGRRLVEQARSVREEGGRPPTPYERADLESVFGPA
jgi:predicted ATPase/DNA-binding SARP family transcriptional activator